MSFVNVVLWVYIVLLVVGGLAGYFKAGSKVSLIMAAGFGVLLALCNFGVIHPFYVTHILVGLLIVTFIIRFIKTRKFMPAGLMLVLSAATLGLLIAGR